MKATTSGALGTLSGAMRPVLPFKLAVARFLHIDLEYLPTKASDTLG